MQIILKQRIQFCKPDVPRTIDNSVTISPSTQPQNVPDWIVNDPYAALLEKSGLLIVVKTMQLGTVADAKAAGSTTEPSAREFKSPEQKQEVPQTGWGAKTPPTVGLGFDKPAAN